MRLEGRLAVLVVAKILEQLLNRCGEGLILGILIKLIANELDLIKNSVGVGPILLTKEVVAMIDSGATNTFISKRFVWDNRIPTRKLQNLVLLFNIDGTENRAGRITEMAVLRMKINDHDEQVVFSVTDIDDEDVIIGLDWLRKHNPDMDWEEGLIKLS